MTTTTTRRHVRVLSFWALLAIAAPAAAQTTPTPPAPVTTYEPKVGQAGKDVVWVPTPEVLVEKMLDLAEVTANDLVMDLGSGDGRNVIGAARRGARAVGVEFNADMVAHAQRRAAEAGVGQRATFVQGDMYEADISKANVMALFLLPENMNRLTPKFLALRPGSRIVSNTFGIEGWDPDRSETVTDDCTAWCTAHLWIVPAQVYGTWEGASATVELKQDFQVVTGTVTAAGTATPIRDGRVRGDRMQFSAGDADYVVTVQDDRMEGTVSTNGRHASWSATRTRK